MAGCGLRPCSQQQVLWQICIASCAHRLIQASIVAFAGAEDAERMCPLGDVNLVRTEDCLPAAAHLLVTYRGCHADSTPEWRRVPLLLAVHPGVREVLL